MKSEKAVEIIKELIQEIVKNERDMEGYRAVWNIVDKYGISLSEMKEMGVKTHVIEPALTQKGYAVFNYAKKAFCCDESGKRLTFPSVEHAEAFIEKEWDRYEFDYYDGNAVVNEMLDALKRNGFELPQDICPIIREKAGELVMELIQQLNSTCGSKHLLGDIEEFDYEPDNEDLFDDISGKITDALEGIYNDNGIPFDGNWESVNIMLATIYGHSFKAVLKQDIMEILSQFGDMICS